jgi:hypothetical protein
MTLKKNDLPDKPQYRGNVGNLLQHWVLCEILEACRSYAGELAFIDAHSMSPFAKERSPKLDHSARLFDSVRDRLPGAQSPYEQAWHKLKLAALPAIGYPNSAAFLTSLWTGSYSLFLCETDSPTAQELDAWVKVARRSPKCVYARVFKKDWRFRFRQGLPVLGDLVFFSFDPDMFSRNSVRNRNPRHMYREDLECFATAIQPISQSLVVQLSTYSAQNDNSQPDVIDVVRSSLKDSGLEIVATARADGNMMSLVLARGIEWSDSLRSFGARFDSWLELVKQPR